jgi:hypothetical protein
LAEIGGKVEDEATASKLVADNSWGCFCLERLTGMEIYSTKKLQKPTFWGWRVYITVPTLLLDRRRIGGFVRRQGIGFLDTDGGSSSEFGLSTTTIISQIKQTEDHWAGGLGVEAPLAGALFCCQCSHRTQRPPRPESAA